MELTGRIGQRLEGLKPAIHHRHLGIGFLGCPPQRGRCHQHRPTQRGIPKVPHAPKVQRICSTPRGRHHHCHGQPPCPTWHPKDVGSKLRRRPRSRITFSQIQCSATFQTATFGPCPLRLKRVFRRHRHPSGRIAWRSQHPTARTPHDHRSRHPRPPSGPCSTFPLPPHPERMAGRQRRHQGVTLKGQTVRGQHHLLQRCRVRIHAGNNPAFDVVGHPFLGKGPRLKVHHLSPHATSFAGQRSVTFQSNRRTVGSKVGRGHATQSDG